MNLANIDLLDEIREELLSLQGSFLIARSVCESYERDSNTCDLSNEACVFFECPKLR